MTSSSSIWAVSSILLRDVSQTHELAFGIDEDPLRRAEGPFAERQCNHAWIVGFSLDEGWHAACDDYEPFLGVTITAHLRLSSGSLVEGRGTVLTHADITAHYTLDKPNEVQISTLPIRVRGAKVEVSIPQRAVVLLELKMT
jgi:hypothetical protein